MKIGQKVTVRFSGGQPFHFLRCYVIRRLPCGWQLYDPIRNWSWGLNENQGKQRVVFAL